MYRRSPRLMSNGYYISDENSDLSPVRAVSYRENLVKVFKKRAKKSKATSHYPTPAITNAPSSSPEPPVCLGQCDGLSSPTALVNKACSGHMRKACSLFVLLLVLLFCSLVNYQKFICPDTSTNPVPNQLTPEFEQVLEKWLTDYIKKQDAVRLTDRGSCSDCRCPMADKMANFALETEGACVISASYPKKYSFFSQLRFFLQHPLESARIVFQDSSVLPPGKCWAFCGSQGALVISLSHPIRITHVTMDRLPVYNSPTRRIDSAPKDFEVYGMKTDTEEGTLLGTFTYDVNGESTQTFKLPNPSDVVYRFVELRVLTNWGHADYTCLYRVRVHGQISST